MINKIEVNFGMFIEKNSYMVWVKYETNKVKNNQVMRTVKVKKDGSFKVSLFGENYDFDIKKVKITNL